MRIAAATACASLISAAMLSPAQTRTAPSAPNDPFASARTSMNRAMASIKDLQLGRFNFDFDGGNLDLPGFDSFREPLSNNLKLPHGTWWRDEDLTKRIGLSAEQQKHIEDLFLQNKIQLIHMHASLEEEELLLQPVLDANPPDQTRAYAQISKIADTRADLEKANAKMLLGIRAVLTSEQWAKLQAEQAAQQEQSMRQMREMMKHMQNGRGPGAPNAPAPPMFPAVPK